MNRRNLRHSLVRRALVLDANNLGQRVINGASLTFLGIILRTLFTIGSMSVLARLLTPADFGYLAMATVVTSFADMLGSFGFANILIQRHRITRLQLDTVFWAAFGVGCTLTFIVIGLSFLTDWLFSDPIVGKILCILSLNFIFSSFSTVHGVLLTRLMHFRTDIVIQTTAIALRSITAVICAWHGFGVWSLVAGSLTGTFTAMMLMILAVRYVPRCRFKLTYLIFSWKTSSSYLGNTIFHYIRMNIDLFLIGRQLGANALGYYQNARSLTDEVRGRLAMPLQRVFFPALSSIQTDTFRLQQSVLKSSRLLAAIICPIGFGISAAAPEIVSILYGEKWLTMIPILTMFGISAALHASTAISSSIFNAQNRVALAFRYNAIGLVLFVGSVAVTLPHGLKVTAAVIAANSLFSVVTFWAGLRLIGLGLFGVAHALLRPIVASFAMWGGILLLRAKFLDITVMGTALHLLLMIACGALIYGITLIVLSRQYWHDFIELLYRILRQE
jgi:PST family polysaccharide transporter